MLIRLLFLKVNVNCVLSLLVCCYTQNLLGNKINCITKFQRLFFLIYYVQHLHNTYYHRWQYIYVVQANKDYH